MSTPEGKVKVWVDKKMKEWFPDAWRMSPQGTIYGSNGQPDRIYLWRGIFVAIEIKSDVGQPSELQLKRLKEISQNGGIAAIVKGRDLEKMEKIRRLMMERAK